MPKEATVKVDMQKVKVLRRKGHAALVEWSDDSRLHRVTVPVKDVVFDPGETSGVVSVESLMQGIPYGIEWEKFLTEQTVLPETLANALRQNGVWTVEDFEQNPNAVMGAVSSILGPFMAQIAGAVKKVKHKEA